MSYAIIETPNFYQGTFGAPQESYVKNVRLDTEQNYNAPGAYDIAFFETEDEAQEVIDSLEEGTYYLSHGEAGRPAYQIVDWEEGDGQPDCYPGTGRYFGGWEEVDPDDLPGDTQSRLDRATVEWSRSSDDFDIYIEVLKGDENDPEQCDDDGNPYRYMIVFCPRSLAIERCEGDLGNIDWDNPGYYREK